MTEAPNPADFSAQTFDGEFFATIRCEGTMRVTIKAATKEEATAQAEALCDRIAEGLDDFEPDDVDEVEVRSVWPRPSMFRVTRAGQKMQVSRLQPGDMPREADERGF